MKNTNNKINKQWVNRAILLTDATIITKELLESSIKALFKSCFEGMSEDIHALLLVRVGFENGNISTITKLLKIN